MKIGFVSLGCSKNLVDTEVMLGLLRDKGWEIVEENEEADIIVVNTCTFIEKAKEESIQAILEMAKLKETGKCRALIVAGCLSQQYQQELFKEIPEIDALLGTGSWNRILEAADAVLAGERVCFMDEMKNIYDDTQPRIRTTPKYSAYIKIADGCINGCTFCIIPKIRGKFRSRPIESIVAEVKQLAAEGVKEFNLIAQDTTSYGVDLSGGKGSLLPQLLRELVKIEGVVWIRLLYLYPTYFTDELLDLIVHEEKICSYVDLPLQHISDPVLKRMNRRDTKADIYALLKKIKEKSPSMVLRTTFIVGFPGETDEQFRELCEFVKEMRFDNAGVFTYSQEEGTAAALMPDQIPEEVKEERYHELMSIQAKISEEKNQDLEGTEHIALIEEVAEENGVYLSTARIATQAPDVDCVTYIEGGAGLEPGDMVPVTISQGFAYELVADIKES